MHFIEHLERDGLDRIGKRFRILLDPVALFTTVDTSAGFKTHGTPVIYGEGTATLATDIEQQGRF